MKNEKRNINRINLYDVNVMQVGEESLAFYVNFPETSNLLRFKCCPTCEEKIEIIEDEKEKQNGNM